MDKKKILVAVFILVAMVQLLVPAGMIFEREDILNSGREFKFETAPVDPNDPFRGKYLTLQYKENIVQLQHDTNWVSGETVYVILKADSSGFAKIHTVSRTKPTGSSDFVSAKVSYVNLTDNDKTMVVAYPFDRFYMEESIAPAADKVFTESRFDSLQHVYALVSVKNGQAVLKDVMIDGVSLVEIAGSRKKPGK